MYQIANGDSEDRAGAATLLFSPINLHPTRVCRYTRATWVIARESVHPPTRVEPPACTENVNIPQSTQATEIKIVHL